MQTSHRCAVILMALLLAVDLPTAQAAGPVNPTPRFAYAGCVNNVCQYGWYSSPAVLDLNGDGAPEVIWSAASVNAVRGDTGALVWRALAGGDTSGAGSQRDTGRTWPDIALADLDGRGQRSIVTAHGGGWVSAYDTAGRFRPGWPRQPLSSAELRTLAADDLDGDGRAEILTARAESTGRNVWTVLQADGSTRSGWPQRAAGLLGYAAGAYNNNVGAADLDGDGRGEIIGPSDVHYISAFEDNGAQTSVNSRFNLSQPLGAKIWGQVGVHVSDAVDLRGYANCGSEHRPNFADSAPNLVDLNGDGALEVVVVGNVYNCGTTPYTNLAHIPFIFKPDRSRWTAPGFDWTTVPALGATSGPPRSEDYNLIENPKPNPATADLDGDGVAEIVYPAYDGKVHAYWLADRAERESWPFNVATLFGGALAYASEPVIADLDGDNKAEVIFGTWPQRGNRRNGFLVVLNWRGQLVQQVPLPAPRSNLQTDYNGALTAPTLAALGPGADLSVLIGTISSGVVAYDLPGSANADVRWATGRGSFRRTGAFPKQRVQPRLTLVAPASPKIGDTVVLNVNIANADAAPSGVVQASVTLPAALTPLGAASANRGTASVSGQTLTWRGAVPAGVATQVSLALRLNTGDTGALRVQGSVAGQTVQAVVLVGGKPTRIPAVRT